MHEVALSRQLAQVVSRAARGRRVVQVRVEVGAMRQVVPETLKYAWGFVVGGTELASATLEITVRPVIIQCRLGHQTTLGAELGFACGTCGAQQTTIMDGEQFRVLDIDVE